MRPKIISSKDMPRVEEALKRFYYARPKEYGLMERSQETYEDYAREVRACCLRDDAVFLDLGSGSWRIPNSLVNQGCSKVIGLDFFSEEKIAEYSKHIQEGKVTLLSYDGGRFPLPDATVDVVSSLCVFEHIPRVRDVLDEIDRVLAPEGVVLIVGPNWSGVNNPVRAMQSLLLKGDRYWQYETMADCLAGIVRSIFWYFRVRLSREPLFLNVEPRMANGEIVFARSDDDVVHLCQPLSFRKYFKRKNYSVLRYNRGVGESRFARFFNTLFPSMATTNMIVARKESAAL